jgi:hypothetical protein
MWRQPVNLVLNIRGRILVIEPGWAGLVEKVYKKVLATSYRDSEQPNDILHDGPERGADPGVAG